MTKSRYIPKFTSLFISIFIAIIVIWQLFQYTYSSQPLVSPSASATTLISKTPSTTPTPTQPSNDSVNNQVPFTIQAPLGNWDDPLQQNGCEEASALMAMAWVRGVHLPSSQEVEKQIVELGHYEQAHYGFSIDSSAQDTLRLLKDYFDYQKAVLQKNISTKDILNQLQKGNIVIVPVNGQRLGNPYYKAPGPLTHMLVVTGYDARTDEFITNDPGTKHGQNYRYTNIQLNSALQNYPSGQTHGTQIKGDTALIAVSR